MRKSWNPNNRSKAELLIDNWLYTRYLAHAYERRMPVPEDAYADFFIPLGECYIEYWGLDTAEYTERQKRKREIFKKYAFQVIELGEEDLTELDDRLPSQLLRHLPDGYRFRETSSRDTEDPPLKQRHLTLVG